MPETLFGKAVFADVISYVPEVTQRQVSLRGTHRDMCRGGLGGGRQGQGVSATAPGLPGGQERDEAGRTVPESLWRSEALDTLTLTSGSRTVSVSFSSDVRDGVLSHVAEGHLHTWAFGPYNQRLGTDTCRTMGYGPCTCHGPNLSRHLDT